MAVTPGIHNKIRKEKIEDALDKLADLIWFMRGFNFAVEASGHISQFSESHVEAITTARLELLGILKELEDGAHQECQPGAERQ